MTNPFKKLYRYLNPQKTPYHVGVRDCFNDDWSRVVWALSEENALEIFHEWLATKHPDASPSGTTSFSVYELGSETVFYASRVEKLEIKRTKPSWWV